MYGLNPVPFSASKRFLRRCQDADSNASPEVLSWMHDNSEIYSHEQFAYRTGELFATAHARRPRTSTDRGGDARAGDSSRWGDAHPWRRD
jgi:hypothetical protein